MSASKIDHDELQRRLEEDELQVLLAHWKDRLTANAGVVTAGVGIVVLVVLAWFLWTSRAEATFRESQLLFGNATAFAQQQKYEDALGQLNQLLNDYSGSDIATPARVLRGNCYYQTKQYDQALTDYRAALPRLQGDDAIPVRIAIIQTLRSSGKFDEALSELNSLEQTAASKTLKEQVLYLKGTTYEDLNDQAKAIEAYKAIPKDSAWFNMAVGRIDWLEAQPVQAIN